MKNRAKVAVRAAAALLLAILTVGALVVNVAAGTTTASNDRNQSPIAVNLSISTFRNIPVKGQMTAEDPENDALKYELTDNPKLGTVQALSDGSFVYTPTENKKGHDSFSYVAIDDAGNISNKAVVSITINKQATSITYADMAGNGSYYAALLLAEKGILTGEKLGSSYFFRPEMPVTRGEFLAMCLALSDTKTIPGITRTGFYDDTSMPQWVKPYVSTALMSGIISGFKNDAGQLVFASQEPVTVREAAVILNNTLKISDVVSAAPLSQDVCPAWSQQAVTNLSACKVMTPSEVLHSSVIVTRAQAADMLASSLEVLKARETGHSLLEWLR